MSKFKVGDKVRLMENAGAYLHIPKGTVGVVAEVKPGMDGDLISFQDDVLPQIGMYAWRFELVEDAKPAPLIDGPGLYRTREGEEVKITGLRPQSDLDRDGSCPNHIWEGVIVKEGSTQCYRPDGSWEIEPGATGAYDLVEKISSTHEPVNQEEQPLIRQFASGATRNLDNNKYDYEGFLSPLVIEAFGKYMHSHRLQKDGTMRGSSNWKLGIPDDVYMKSMWRHFFDVWKLYSGYEVLSPEDGHSVNREEALCAVLFNVQGMLHELLKHSNDRPTE